MSEDTIDRRSFGAGLATAVAAAALLRDREAEAQPRPSPALAPTPPERPVAPLPFPAGGLQGLSERLLRSHHENNYAGAVRKLNEIRRQLAAADPEQAGGYWSLYGSLKAAELAARNSALLHELYFANLGPPPAGDAGVALPAILGALVAARFGSLERLQALLRGAAKASNGWVVLVTDPASRTLEVVQTEGHAFGAWEASPLLVLDLYEHAYALDFGADKGAYFTAVWRNVRWDEVHRRATQALGRL
ncbi:MAG: superoxide dismutase [Deltaproteobacteria bacterium]|nr:superoxide dismutase [Deltaproteobacteria bacterium]